MPKKAQPDLSFEEALHELEALVEKMEGDEISLEQSLESFERGVFLTRTCQKALSSAEQKVQILTSDDPDAEPEPFDRNE